MNGYSLQSFQNKPLKPLRVKKERVDLSVKETELLVYLSDTKNWELPGSTKLSRIFKVAPTTIQYLMRGLRKRKDNPAIPEHLREKLS